MGALERGLASARPRNLPGPGSGRDALTHPERHVPVARSRRTETAFTRPAHGGIGRSRGRTRGGSQALWDFMGGGHRRIRLRPHWSVRRLETLMVVDTPAGMHGMSACRGAVRRAAGAAHRTPGRLHRPAGRLAGQARRAPVRRTVPASEGDVSTIHSEAVSWCALPYTHHETALPPRRSHTPRRELASKEPKEPPGAAKTSAFMNRSGSPTFKR